jgi:transcriptional regulator with GAF, ATPase, and Fis domain
MEDIPRTASASNEPRPAPFPHRAPLRRAPTPTPPASRAEVAGRSRAMQEMLAWACRAARTRLPVLIHGETGSGKEGLARLIHESSPRRQGPFVAFNCTALPESLLESELFGCCRGAYTGSVRDRRGLFEVADGGTLLLDEVGDMPLAMQGKLLRVLQENAVRPVGAELEVSIDVRIVAATHRDLGQLVRRRHFRSDLYYRMAVLEVRVPPLRDRLEDLPLLVEALAPQLERDVGRGPLVVTPGAMERLGRHHWPGNVRELQTVLARALLRSDGAPVEPRHIERPRREQLSSDDGRDGRERRMIVDALRDGGQTVAGAARRIGWSRQKLYRRMRALGLD